MTPLKMNSKEIIFMARLKNIKDISPALFQQEENTTNIIQQQQEKGVHAYWNVNLVTGGEALLLFYIKTNFLGWLLSI